MVNRIAWARRLAKEMYPLCYERGVLKITRTGQIVASGLAIAYVLNGRGKRTDRVELMKCKNFNQTFIDPLEAEALFDKQTELVIFTT